jgi:hypothetical protein
MRKMLGLLLEVAGTFDLLLLLLDLLVLLLPLLLLLILLALSAVARWSSGARFSSRAH